MNNTYKLEKKQFEERTSKSVVIIGAGIAGLFAGWKLSVKGFTVTVLEREGYVGGLSTSIQHEGYKIDIGPHYVTIPKKSHFVNEIKNIMGKENIIELSNIHAAYKTYFNGKIFDRYPTLHETIFNSFTSFIQTIFSYAFARSKQFFLQRTIKNSKDYLTQTYSKYLYEKWFRPYLKSNFGTDNISLNDIEDRFPPISLKKFLFKRRKNSQKLESSALKNEYNYWYFREGMGSFAHELQKSVLKTGGKIICNATVDDIEHDSCPKKIHYSKNNERYEIFSDIIVYATPNSVTAKWFNTLPENNRDELEKITSYNTIMIFLFVDCSNLFDGWIISVCDTDLPFFRIAQQNFLSDNVTPQGKSLLSIEIRSSDNDPIWKLDNESLISQIKKKIEKMGIVNSKKIEGYKVIKFKNLSPVGYVDSENSHKSLKKIVDSIKNEYLVGTENDSGNLLIQRTEYDEQKVPQVGGFCSTLINSEKLVSLISGFEDK